MKHYDLYQLLLALKAEENMPYALYADAASQALDTANHNPDYAWVRPTFEKYIAEYKGTPIEAPTYQALADWKRRGQRGDFDRQMYAIRTRLNRMWLAALLELPGAAAECEDVLYAYLHLHTWSLSAHHFENVLEDYWDIPVDPYDETGRIRGIGRSRKQCLDLCSCSGAAILAEMAQTLEGKIDSNLLRWARQECVERVLKPFMSLSPFPHFEVATNNWSGVCLSSIGIAAMYLITDPATLAPVLARVLESLQLHENGYKADGASPEGFGYWQYGFEYFLMFIDLLKKRTGGRIDLFEDEKLYKIAGFGADCCFGPSIKLPFGDCNWKGVLDEAVRRYTGALGVNVCPQGDTKESFESAWEHGNLMLRHLIWTMQPDEQAQAYPRSATYPVSELFMGFYRKPEDPLYLLVKGGNNGESHNHNDVGSFVLIRNGTMPVADTTGGRYTKDYFSENRYTYFVTRSGGHNFPIVDGVEQVGHGRCRAKKFEVTHGEDRDTVFMDLSGTLETDSLASFTRTVTGLRKNGTVCVRDIFTLTRAARIQDRLVTLGEPVQTDEGLLLTGCVLLHYDEKSLEVKINPVDHRFDGKQVYTVDLIPKSDRPGTVEVEMRFEAV